jgi:hypothetical protein
MSRLSALVERLLAIVETGVIPPEKSAVASTGSQETTETAGETARSV